MLGKPPATTMDIYAFGIMLYEMLKGEAPFLRGDIRYQIMNVMPEAIKEIPDWLNNVIQRCTAKDYRLRFQDVKEIIGAIERKDAGEVKKLYQHVQTSEAKKQIGEEEMKKSNVILIVSAILIIAVIAIAGVWMYSSNQKTKAELKLAQMQAQLEAQQQALQNQQQAQKQEQALQALQNEKQQEALKKQRLATAIEAQHRLLQKKQQQKRSLTLEGTYTIPSDGTKVNLGYFKAGATYYLEVKGIYQYATGVSSEAQADGAAYVYLWNQERLWQQVPKESWGLEIHDGDEITTFRSLSYNPDHIYKINYIGNGTTPYAVIMDDYYPDNSGSITIEKYGYK